MEGGPDRRRRFRSPPQPPLRCGLISPGGIKAQQSVILAADAADAADAGE